MVKRRDPFGEDIGETLPDRPVRPLPDRSGEDTGETLPDGAPGYAVRQLMLDCTVQPAPVVLSEAQRNRLGGSSGGVQPLIRHRKAFGATNHSYWQDPARPACFYFLPDRFLLARKPDGNREPLLRVRGIVTSGGEPGFAVEFVARPVIDLGRLAAARSQLEEAARQRGASEPLTLEIVPDPQPVLRLALPRNGAPSHAMTERPDADVDLETGIWHAETMGLEDFQLVYQALFGASLTLLRGEVRAAMGGGAPEDVPIELRIDKTIGDMLAATPGAALAEGLGYRLVNAIESPVRIDRLSATAQVGDKLVRLRTLIAGQRLAPGQGIDVVLEAEEPIAAPGPDAIVFDQSGVVVEPDPAAVWAVVFDRSAAAQPPWPVTVEAAPLLFAGADRPDDRVVAFVVTVEHGGTVRLTEAEPRSSTTVRRPLEPLITGAPMPPIRYRTETLWGSGGIGVSPWREVDGTILSPVKTPPA